MKTILFCNLPYAFSIMKPLADALEKRGDAYLWYISPLLIEQFPYKTMQHTDSIKELERFESDAIFVPGNDVPYWLRGVKIQIFHGLAGEKKGHFRIREYFDLYLTQGPYFTKKFQLLADKHKNFKVKETGWCKLDTLYNYTKQTHKDKTILYAPTFSPSLTSAKRLLSSIELLSQEYKIIIKFHDKMDKALIATYQAIESERITISQLKDITPLLQQTDLMISDTSSVVYEYILLNKPVVTLESKSQNINWENYTDVQELEESVRYILEGKDKFKNKREETIALYHPYSDGHSSERMIEATEDYINTYGVPQKRRLPLLRKWKLWHKYR